MYYAFTFYRAKSKSKICSLYILAQEGNKDIVEFLVKHRADIECKHASGATPFITACVYGQASVIRYLGDNNANINAQLTEDGNTGLHEAVFSNNLDVIRAILRYKPDLTKNLEGQTPLDIAEQCKHYKAAALLVSIAEIQSRGIKCYVRKWEKNLQPRPNSITSINDDVDVAFLNNQYKQYKKKVSSDTRE